MGVVDSHTTREGMETVRFFGVASVVQRKLVAMTAMDGNLELYERKVKGILRSRNMFRYKEISITTNDVGLIHYNRDDTTMYIGGFISSNASELF